MSFDLLAEVSAALTGFAGIIIAVRSRETLLPRLQLVGFLQNSLAVLLLSLVASFLLEAFNDTVLVYRYLCGLLAAYHAYIALAYHLKQHRIAEVPWFQSMMGVLTIPLIVLKTTAALGFLDPYIQYIFYFALLWNLTIAIFIFSQVLLAVSDKPASQP